MLFPTKPKPFKYHNKKLLVHEIESFDFRLTPSKALLAPTHRRALNPLLLNIVGAKQLPEIAQIGDKFTPIYVKLKFFNGDVIRTQGVPHASTCKWRFKHVFLIGKMDPVWVKEQLASVPLTFEVHDKDMINRNVLKEMSKLIQIEEEPEEEEEEEVEEAKGKRKRGARGRKEKEKEKEEEREKGKKGKAGKGRQKKGDPISEVEAEAEETKTPQIEMITNQFGICSFMLTDFLKTNVRKLKLLSAISPIKKFKDTDYANLDLNTTAKKELRKLEIMTSYLDLGSYLVITLDLADEIGAFKIEKKVEEVVKKVETKVTSRK